MWIALIFIVMALVFFKLGAYSIILIIMSIIVKIILALILTLSGVLVFRWYRNRLKRRRYLTGGYHGYDRR